MVEIDDFLEEIEIEKQFKEACDINIGSEIAGEIVKKIIDIVRFYESSDKKTVAYGFVPKLMNLESDIYEKYYKFFFKQNVSSFSIGRLIGDRIEFYINLIEENKMEK